MSKPSAATVAKFAALLKLDPAALPTTGRGRRALTVEEAIAGRLYAIEVRAVCSRCGGSGRYSFNQMDGDRCYGCGGRGTKAAPLTRANYAAAEVAVAAGKLDAYFAACKAKAEALAATKPLIKEAGELIAAYRGSDGSNPAWLVARECFYSSAVMGPNDTHNPARASVLDVESALQFGKLDPEVGVLFAAEILHARVAELRALAAK